MARKPKPSRPTEASAAAAEPELPMLNEAPAPVRRGRPPKSAKAPLPSSAAADDSVAGTDVAGADEAGADARDIPPKRRQGRKPKLPAGAVAVPLSRDEPRRVKRQQGRKPDDAESAAEPGGAVRSAEGGDEDGMPAGSDADQQNVAESQAADEAATPAAVSGPMASSKPVAQWDASTDTVQFDWSEIERTASQGGPNQIMAKLLIAARAEGAQSRWPF